ncbi:MAG: flagellar filament capping protein FliD [Clostridiaceae bacterium]
MATVNFLGSYSGIDQTMIDQLMAIEKRPLIKLSEKKESIGTQKNAWNDVKTRLNNLFEKLKALQSSETYTSKLASPGGSASLVVSKNSVEGTYQIHVDQLATSTSIVGSAIPNALGDSSKALGISGNFTINASAEIEVIATDTTRSIAEKINLTSKTSGIRASIIDSKLVLNNIQTGNKEIALGDVAGKVAILDDLGLGGLKDVNLGKNALFTINDVAIERSSNTISDVLDYTSINLTKEHALGQFDTINVTQDTSKSITAVKEFVAQYNSTLQFLNDQVNPGKVGVENSRGKLAGDGSIIRLQSTLRSMASSSIVNSTTEVNNLSKLGITTIDRYGQLQLDESKLEGVLKADPEQVKNFFISKNELGEDIGFVPQMNTYIDSFSSSTGIIKDKADSYEKALKDIAKQVETFNARIAKKEQYYISMFSKLDTAMMKSESQMSWLTSQVSGMTSSK